MKALGVLIFSFLAFSSFGQVDLISKEGSDYIYRGDAYKSNQLEEVYLDSPKALELYKSGRAYKTVGKSMGYVGLFMIATGTYGLITNLDGLVIFGTGAIAAGILIELISIAPSVIGSKKLKKAMETFNFEKLEKHGYQSEYSLSLGFSGNKLGLLYQF